MNIQQFGKQLEKVNRFYEYLLQNEDIISNIDRDRMLMHLRELYDNCFEQAEEKEPEVEEEVPQPEPEVVEKRKQPKLIFTSQVVEEESRPVVVEPEKVVPKVEKEQPELETKIAPVVEKQKEPVVEKAKEELVEEEKKEDVKELEIRQIPVAEPKEDTKQEATKEKQKNTAQRVIKKPERKEKPVVVVEKTSDGFNPEYDELFTFKTATDISQKLSQKPIENLNHALGLNEKFQYVSTLFGGNAAQFKLTVERINNSKSFEETRIYLEESLMDKYKWTSKKRKLLAKDFIKLVRRRFL